MSRPGSSDRQALRKQRLIEAEKEQLREDQEALKLTEDQRQSLLTSFSSVKTQFFDLDGLMWTRSALKKRAQSEQLPPRKTSSTIEDSEALSPLTNTFSSYLDVDSDSWEDTIRPGGELGALLASHYSAESKSRSHSKDSQTPSRDPTPRYITYSKSQPNATPTPRSFSPGPLEQPTPRPIHAVSREDPHSPTPTPSLKRRLPSDGNAEAPSDAKRAHTSSGLRRVLV
ncbi:hypothetical protein BDZ89DRAFT_1108501 [Hymenopellis radicata]|nr:hypothetical protein BDZ89DRAFT_1108501 [Hymenopellis radicata]